MNQMGAVRRLLLLVPLIFGNSIIAAAQTDSIYRLPAGTPIRLRMDVELSSKFASANDTFTATVAKPVIRDDVVVLAEGTQIEGRVLSSSAASTASKDGRMDVVFESLKLEGTPKRSIEAVMQEPLSERSSSGPSMLSIVGGAAAGALIGSVTNTRTGIILGASLGAGAGAGVALARKGKDVRIRQNEEFEIVLKRDVVLPVRDY